MLTVDYLQINAFRKFEEGSRIKIGENITLIVGQNATSVFCQPKFLKKSE